MNENEILKLPYAIKCDDSMIDNYCSECKIQHSPKHYCTECLACFLYDGSKHCMQHNKCHNIYHNYKICKSCEKCYYSFNTLSKCYNCGYDPSNNPNHVYYYKREYAECLYCKQKYIGCYGTFSHWFCQFKQT